MSRSPCLLRSERALAPPCDAAADDIVWRRDPGERERPGALLNCSMRGNARWMSAEKRDHDRVTEMDEECMLIF